LWKTAIHAHLDRIASSIPVVKMFRIVRIVGVAVILAAGLAVSTARTTEALPPNCSSTSRQINHRNDVYQHGDGHAISVLTRLWGCNTSTAPYLVAEGSVTDISASLDMIEMRILGLHVEWRRASDGGGFGFVTGINSATPFQLHFVDDWTSAKACSDGRPTQYEYRAAMTWQVRWENGALSTPRTQVTAWVPLCR
jgi:hypothetical protein